MRTVWTLFLLWLVLSIAALGANGDEEEVDDETLGNKRRRAKRKERRQKEKANKQITVLDSIDNLDHVKEMEKFLGTLDDELDQETRTKLSEEYKKVLTACNGHEKCREQYSNAATNMQQTAAGLSAASSIADALAGLFDNDDFVGTMKKLVGAISPFLGAVGPIVELFSMFEDSSEVQLLNNLLNVVDKGFIRMDNKLDAIQNQIGDLQDLMIQKHFEAGILEELKVIHTTSQRVQNYRMELQKCLKNITGHCKRNRHGVLKSIELTAAKAELNQATYSELFARLNALSQAFSGEGAYTPETSVCSVLIETANSNKREVLRTSIHYFSKMVIGAQDYLTIGEVLGKRNHTADVLEAMLTGVSHNMSTCNKKIETSGWKWQWKTDVEKLMQKHGGVGFNSDRYHDHRDSLLKELRESLEYKYDWRQWFVFVAHAFSKEDYRLETQALEDTFDGEQKGAFHVIVYSVPKEFSSSTSKTWRDSYTPSTSVSSVEGIFKDFEEKEKQGFQLRLVIRTQYHLKSDRRYISAYTVYPTPGTNSGWKVVSSDSIERKPNTFQIFTYL